MSLFKNDDEFWQAFHRLNALGGEWGEWRATEARKEHEDEFGVEIERGEVYFKKQIGSSCIAKFSRSSMEEVLYAVVATSPQIEMLADEYLKARQERLREVSRRMADAMERIVE